jgi:3-phenylpropionate/trans-cinnamate dioxygenase ferredoxin subunit
MTETPLFTRACALSDLPAEDVCSHAEVPLSEGEVYDHTVECWLHGSCFDLRTGQPTGPPATVPVPVYPVKIEGDDVYVAVKES